MIDVNKCPINIGDTVVATRSRFKTHSGYVYSRRIRADLHKAKVIRFAPTMVIIEYEDGTQTKKHPESLCVIDVAWVAEFYVPYESCHFVGVFSNYEKAIDGCKKHDKDYGYVNIDIDNWLNNEDKTAFICGNDYSYMVRRIKIDG